MIWRPAAPERTEIDESREHRESRNEQFRTHGIDREGMIGFVVDAAEPLPGRVLDIGTGRGFAAVELARRGAGVATIDTSEEMLKSAAMGVFHSMGKAAAQRDPLGRTVDSVLQSLGGSA